jgi:hypothetical protein
MMGRPAKSPAQLARQFLRASDEKIEWLREHDFGDDEVAQHDDGLHEELCEEFSAEVDRLKEELSKTYGKPLRAGSADSRLVPVNGVFRYAVWRVGGKRLYVVASREERECPVVLVLGTVPERSR